MDFLPVQQGLFGLYLGCSLAPNHKGMPTLGRNDKTDFLRRQVLTAEHPRWPDHRFRARWLNYQLEHHLFPSMPRHAVGGHCVPSWSTDLAGRSPPPDGDTGLTQALNVPC
ncbi:hypothetical protein [Actinomadura sp. KC216]|uniref:hypothetical protein n=1 Tax=Actinomadura sp. KC216 TaxID=2530370 RepID=UPI001FB8013F|nr:hypothetical protein [Actinomadura sp. KC216]